MVRAADALVAIAHLDVRQEPPKSRRGNCADRIVERPGVAPPNVAVIVHQTD